MLSHIKAQEKFDKTLKKERKENVERIMWLSFCDPERPRGERFLGVIITPCLGLSHAILKTHDLGINPEGEIMSYEIHDNSIDPRHYNKLLSSEKLKQYGYYEKRKKKKFRSPDF